MSRPIKRPAPAAIATACHGLPRTYSSASPANTRARSSACSSIPASRAFALRTVSSARALISSTLSPVCAAVARSRLSASRITAVKSSISWVAETCSAMAMHSRARHVWGMVCLGEQPSQALYRVSTFDEEAQPFEQLRLRRQDVDGPESPRVGGERLLARIGSKPVGSAAVNLDLDSLTFVVVPPFEDDLLRQPGRSADCRERDDAVREIHLAQADDGHARDQPFDRLRDSGVRHGKPGCRYLAAQFP